MLETPRKEKDKHVMRIGIVGAGISGLSAAQMLARQGHAVCVYEAAPEVGGLASAFEFDGVPVEKFYHFLCAGDEGYVSLCRDLGIQDRLHWTSARTGFFYNGREYPFSSPLDLLRFSPIPLGQRLRFGLFALETRWREQWRQLDEIPAAPWLIDRIGQEAYDVIWRPLLAMKFWEEHTAISAAWVWHRLHRVARSKGRMGYLEGGSALLFKALMDDIEKHGGKIHTGCPIAAIEESHGGVSALKTADGQKEVFDRVISTVPLTLLADLLPESRQAYAEKLRRVRYVGVVCAVMKLARPLTRNFWLNINDARIPSNGIIEFTNLNRGLCKESIVYVPYYVYKDSELYQSSDKEVVEKSRAILQCVAPSLKTSDVLAHSVFRDPYAQAVCPTGFLNVLPESATPMTGLYLLDSTLLYPEDRTQSGLILRARACCRELLQSL